MAYETFKKEILANKDAATSIVRYGTPNVGKDRPDMFKFIGGCTHNKEEFEDYARRLYQETGIRFVLVKIWKKHLLFWRYQPLYFLASHPFDNGLDVCKNMEETINRPDSFNQDKPWHWIVEKTFI